MSKTLAPGLRLGWMVPALSLLTELVGAKRDDDFGSPVLGQHVLAQLLSTGTYERHLRRQRGVYGMRRAALLQALAEELPGWAVRGSASGLHLWLEPPEPVDEAALVRAALERDVLVLGLQSMCRQARLSGLAWATRACAHSTHRRSPGACATPCRTRRRERARRPQARSCCRPASPHAWDHRGRFFPAGTGLGVESPLVPDPLSET